jgi:hypothetical protein
MTVMRAIKAQAGPAQTFDPLRFCVPAVDADRRRALIAEAAYMRAEGRGFAAGHEVEDWLAAEAEIDRRLVEGNPLNTEYGGA